MTDLATDLGASAAAVAPWFPGGQRASLLFDSIPTTGSQTLLTSMNVAPLPGLRTAIPLRIEFFTRWGENVPGCDLGIGALVFAADGTLEGLAGGGNNAIRSGDVAIESVTAPDGGGAVSITAHNDNAARVGWAYGVLALAPAVAFPDAP